jgi:hypothetical protein
MTSKLRSVDSRGARQTDPLQEHILSRSLRVIRLSPPGACTCSPSRTVARTPETQRRRGFNPYCASVLIKFNNNNKTVNWCYWRPGNLLRMWRLELLHPACTPARAQIRLNLVAADVAIARVYLRS